MSIRLASTSKVLETEKITSEVSVSSKIINRGNEFNLYIIINNPFDNLLTITGWSWVYPPGIHGVSQDSDKGFTLQPGDSRSLSFRLKANGLIDYMIGVKNHEDKRRRISWDSIVKTGEHFISLNFSYDKDGKAHWQEVQASLNIYAAPVEIYVSAIIGAVAGSLMRKPFGIETIISGVLGFFFVLMAKRRTDVQLGFSVEDWIGGIILGFSVGYFGSSYFENIMSPKTT